MLKKSVARNRRTPFCLILGLSAFLLSTAVPQSATQKPGAWPVVTDQGSTSVSDKYSSQAVLGLKENGDVFFGGFSVFSYWSYSSATRTRLLQWGDPIPGYPETISSSVASPFQLNSAGHAAMVHTWAQKGVRDPSGIFVYDGSQYTKVALSGEATPGISGSTFSAFRDIRINQNDQVAFIADYDPIGPYITGLFVGSPGGAVQKIASLEELEAIDGNRYNTIQLIGIDNSGRVAFLCDQDSDPNTRAIFIGDTTGFQRVVANGDPAPGTAGSFNLSTAGVSPYALNSAGDLAVRANVNGDASVWVGIWVRTASGTLQKLATNNDSTGTGLGGVFGGSITLRGFNNVGKVLFSSNPSGGAGSSHALFLKDAASQAQVVFYNGQGVAGRTESFNSTGAALLNDSGDVAFFASLSGGTSSSGLFWGSGQAAPKAIALRGDAAPTGGVYGALVSNLRINNNGQVVFSSDILGLNAAGLFIWTPGNTVQPIVSTNDSLPPGANKIPGLMGVSDDEVLFLYGKAGSNYDCFTRSLRNGTIRRIIGAGDPMPGGGVVSIVAIPPAINNKEEAVVLANWILGGPTYPARAILISRPGSALQKMAMTGDSLPGSGGGTILSFATAPLINNNSQVVFQANIAGSTGGSTSGIFMTTLGGAIQKIVRLGDASPGGGAFAGFAAVSMNDAGQVGFEATIQDGSVQRKGLFVGSPTSAPVKLVAEGDSWGSVAVSGITSHSKINSAGQMAYLVSLPGNHDAIFLGTPGALPALIAQEGGSAPFPVSSVFVEFSISDTQDTGMVINDNGQVAFWAVYTNTAGPILGTYGTGIFIGSAGSSPVARLYSGAPLPGSGSFYGSLPAVGTMALANSGELAMYVPYVYDAPNLPRLVIAGNDGVLRDLAEVGQTAADTGSEFGKLQSLNAVTTNSSGGFFFSALLVNGPARSGIFGDNFLPQAEITLSAGGASVITTPGGNGPMRVGYANLALSSGDAPYGTAVFSFTQNGVTVSEAGVPASPPTTSARIFIDFGTAVNAVPGRADAGTIDINTGIAIVNAGSSTAHVTYTLRDLNGGNPPLAVGHGTIAAGNHFAKFIDQLKDVAPDFNMPSSFLTTAQSGSLEITSDQPLSVLGMRGTSSQRGEFLFTTTPVADLTRSPANSPMYFPEFVDGGGYTTSLFLLNASSQTESGTLQILDDNGAPLVVNQVGGTADSSFKYSIPANGAFRFRTDGFPADVKVGSVLLTPDAGSAAPIGSGVFSYNPGSVLVSESGIPAAASTTHARVYVDLSGRRNTGLAIANHTGTSARITINAFQTDGVTRVGNSQGPLQLAAKGHAAKFANEFISGLPAGFVGVLDISSTTPFAALAMRTLQNERDDFLFTTFPIAYANQTAPSPVVFPEVVDGGGYVTQFILLSAGGPSTMTLGFYGEDGQPLAVGK